MAAIPARATLRAAVLQVPFVALKMSTVLTAALFTSKQSMSNQRQQHKHTSTHPQILHLPDPTFQPLQSTQITEINKYYALMPPANIASPSFGSDVAARHCRATLRAAVLQVPFVALKMSTVLKESALLPSKQRMSNQRQYHKQTSSHPLAQIMACPSNHCN